MFSVAKRAVLFLGFFIALTAHEVRAQTYVPLLDEYDGVKANDGNYLILPAFENTTPGIRRKAYFIFPKFLEYAVDPADGSLTLGVNHIGFSLLPDGSPDYAPRAAIVATLVAVQDNKTVAAIKDELTKRDVAQGLQDPSFPVPTFESYEISIVAAGLASNDKDTTESYDGGYPGQPFLVKINLKSDADRAFVLETPASAGRDAKIWGVAVRGKIKGYGNRLNCSVHMNHKQVYNYFAGRATGQAYWGIVKADVSKEVKSMSDKQVIDFGACRGSPEMIDKLVMPAWQLILEMQNGDGQKMFYQMVKDVTAPNHPGESQSGWGFQASAKWAEVSSEQSIDFNFNVSTPIYWTLPMSISFSSSCAKLKANFINGSDPKKPCVDARDASRIAAAQRACVVKFATEISKLPFPDDQKNEMYKQLRKDGCGFNFTSPNVQLSLQDQEKLSVAAVTLRKQVMLDIAADLKKIDDSK